jgi:hypothetical protein
MKRLSDQDSKWTQTFLMDLNALLLAKELREQRARMRSLVAIEADANIQFARELVKRLERHIEWAEFQTLRNR